MAKPTRKPLKATGTASAVSNTFSPQPPSSSGRITQQRTHVYQGPVPHPDVLERFDQIVPGSAERLIQLAENESRHRQDLERKATEANISAQKKQMEIADYQSKAVFRSDLVGQICGLVVALACIAAAFYLAANGQPWVAVALAGIPTAAVIQAFFAKRPAPPQPQPEEKQK